MPRRNVGISGIQRRRAEQEMYKQVGEEMASDQLKRLAGQLEAFKKNLEEFSLKHKTEIKSDPDFRFKFQQMCASIGVDPLASSKGFWSETLGVGDFYYELAVRVIEVCLALSESTGGIIAVDQVKDRLNASTRVGSRINSNDVIQAVSKLKVLGNGFKVVRLPGDAFYIQSVPSELSIDHLAVMNLAQERGGYVTFEGLCRHQGWSSLRAEQCLRSLVQSGMVWEDRANPNEVQYWLPSIFRNIKNV